MAIAAIQSLRGTFLEIPNPPAILLLIIVFSSYVGGFASGLASGAISWAYFAFFFSLPGAPFHFTPENLRRVFIWAVTIPLTVTLVGRLKRREEAALRAMASLAKERFEELARRGDELRNAIDVRQLAQDQLQTKERLIRLISDNLPAAVLYIDKDLHFQFVNEIYAKWRGARKDEILGRHVREIIGEELYRTLIPVFFERILAGQEATHELDRQHADRQRVINIVGIPDFDAAGKVRGFICVATDISQYKAIELDLMRSRDAAEAANRAKSAFLANMSHEIRTPLGAVLGFSELILDPKLFPSDRVIYAAAIKRNGDLLSQIVSDILDLSKIEAGKLTIDTTETAVSDFLRDIETFMNLKAAEKGIRLSIRSEGEIPRMIVTDPVKLRQILINIVGNAIKFTERGSVDVTVKQMAVAGQKSRLAFIVRDTGPGVRPEVASKIFELFTQGDISTTRRFGGAGLGLPLAKRLAQALGGDAELTESIPGAGSTFTISIDPGEQLAATVPCYQEGNDSTRRGLANDDAMRIDGIKILLVEDAPDNQLLIKRILKFAGATVNVVGNGQEGVREALQINYDVLLMDLQMPVMDGYEAATLLRKQGYKSPIVALTAHAFSEERTRCLSAGFNDFISKPVSRKLLINCLKRCIDSTSPQCRPLA